MGGPKGSIIKISSFWTGVMYNGKEYDPGPDPIPVKKGDTIYVYASVVNGGDETGPIWVRMVDRKSGKTLLSDSFTAEPGTGARIGPKAITVDSDMELVVEAGHVGPDGEWYQDDEWGC